MHYIQGTSSAAAKVLCMGRKRQVSFLYIVKLKSLIYQIMNMTLSKFVSYKFELHYKQ